MAKIAVELNHALARRLENGEPGRAEPRRLAEGAGWSVTDVVCTSGPGDRPFEERHEHFSIAIVAAGSFQYRSAAGRALMTPGSLLLGNAGHCFECGHEHAAGDRCIAFHYAPKVFERIAADAVGGESGRAREFHRVRVPPLRALSPTIAAACAGLVGAAEPAWEELGIQLVAQAVRLAAGLPAGGDRLPSNALARVTEAARAIEHEPAAAWSLASLAAEARLSPYHFLRGFERVTGVTPHQYLLRCRLRAAALRLASEPARIIDVALDCGFGDVSNFNRAFRAEFGSNPRAFQRKVRGEP